MVAVAEHCRLDSRPPVIRGQRGFTLIELLVVLLIMGLVVGLASAIVRPDENGLLRVEAERLALVLDLASDEARFTGAPIAWTAEASGYRFWRMSGEGDWSEVLDRDELRARELPAGMRIAALRLENIPTKGGMRLEFAPYSAAVAYDIALSLGASRYSVVSSPIGELTLVPGPQRASDELAAR